MMSSVQAVPSTSTCFLVVKVKWWAHQPLNYETKKKKLLRTYNCLQWLGRTKQKTWAVDLRSWWVKYYLCQKSALYEHHRQGGLADATSADHHNSVLVVWWYFGCHCCCVEDRKGKAVAKEGGLGIKQAREDKRRRCPYFRHRFFFLFWSQLWSEKRRWNTEHRYWRRENNYQWLKPLHQAELCKEFA